MTDSNHSLLRSAGVVGANTLLSRVLGYIRDRFVAHLLGTSVMADAFYAAFRLPNTFRRLMGEGALTAAVVPVFTDARERINDEAAWTLANRLFFVVACILAALALAGAVFSAQVLSLTGFAAHGDAAALVEAVTLNRVIFPYLFFICLAALAQALLNSVGVFGPSAFTPVLLNLSMIAAAYFFGRGAEHPARALAWGVLAGGVLQLGFQLPFLWRCGMHFIPTRPIFSPRVIQVAWLFVPAAFGAGISQVNILVGTLIATYLDEGSVASLYYADRIMELAYGGYALGIATVALPALSRRMAREDFAGAKETLAFALRVTLFVMLPATAGLLVLRGPIVEVLFLGGRYDARSIEMTSFALLFYAMGLTGYAWAKIMVTAFYAEKDTKTPVRAGVAAFATNLLLMSFLIRPLGHGGIALANVLASYVNFAVLAVIFLRRHGALDFRALGTSIAKTVFASLGMAASVFFLARAVGLAAAPALLTKALLLGLVIGAGIAVYFLLAALMRAKEAAELGAAFREKIPFLNRRPRP